MQAALGLGGTWSEEDGHTTGSDAETSTWVSSMSPPQSMMSPQLSTTTSPPWSLQASPLLMTALPPLTLPEALCLHACVCLCARERGGKRASAVVAEAIHKSFGPGFCFDISAKQRAKAPGGSRATREGRPSDTPEGPSGCARAASERRASDARARPSRRSGALSLHQLEPARVTVLELWVAIGPSKVCRRQGAFCAHHVFASCPKVLRLWREAMSGAGARLRLILLLRLVHGHYRIPPRTFLHSTAE